VSPTPIPLTTDAAFFLIQSVLVWFAVTLLGFTTLVEAHDQAAGVLHTAVESNACEIGGVVARLVYIFIAAQTYTFLSGRVVQCCVYGNSFGSTFFTRDILSGFTHSTLCIHVSNSLSVSG
jgi:hypothetical protein